jgi:hypothetical protein
MYYNPSCCIIFEHGTSFKSKKICKIWELIFKLLTVRQPFYFFKSKLFLVTLIIIDYHKFTYTLLIHILFLWGHVFLKDWESMVQELFVFIQILQKRLWSVNLFITERGNQKKRLWYVNLFIIERGNQKKRRWSVNLFITERGNQKRRWSVNLFITERGNQKRRWSVNLFITERGNQKKRWSVNLFITERGNQIKRRLCSYRLWHAMKLLLIGRLNGEVNYLFVCLLVFNATFNNISVISWRKPENHRKPSTCRKSLTNFIT